MNLCETIFRKSVIIKQYLRQLNSLRDELKTVDTKDKLAEIQKRYKEIESSRSTKIANHIVEIKEISEAMKALDLDYQDSIATLEEFKVIERKENGEIFYKGDYDPSKEKGYDKNNESKDKHYLGKEYEVPTLEEIFARMTPEQIKLYAEMKEGGLEPKLQLTPIAKKIRSLAKHIDEYKEYPKKTENTYVWDEIKDEELIYEPEDYETNNDGNKLITKGGKTKSKWIEDNNGWIVDIVATVQDLEADSEITTDANNQEYTNAEKTVKYHKKNKPRYRGMSYESYLIAQMRALRKGKPLEDKNWTILTDSSIQNATLVSSARWDNVQVYLFGDYADYQYHFLRWRCAVRVY